MSLCCALPLSPSGRHRWAWSLEFESAHLQLINHDQHTLIYPDQPSRPRRIVESVTVRKPELVLVFFETSAHLFSASSQTTRPQPEPCQPASAAIHEPGA